MVTFEPPIPVGDPSSSVYTPARKRGFIPEHPGAPPPTERPQVDARNPGMRTPCADAHTVRGREGALTDQRAARRGRGGVLTPSRHDPKTGGADRFAPPTACLRAGPRTADRTDLAPPLRSPTPPALPCPPGARRRRSERAIYGDATMGQTYRHPVARLLDRSLLFLRAGSDLEGTCPLARQGLGGRNTTTISNERHFHDNPTRRP